MDPKQSRCECYDPECPHAGPNHRERQCLNLSVVTLHRIDMADETGVPLCQECADDAMDSGVFGLEDIEENRI